LQLAPLFQGKIERNQYFGPVIVEKTAISDNGKFWYWAILLCYQYYKGKLF